MNNLLKNFTGDIFAGAEVLRSGFVGVHPLRNIYLLCYGLGNFNTRSVAVDRNILKHIIVNACFGNASHCESATGWDHLDRSR